jgi:hypothetical protein
MNFDLSSLRSILEILFFISNIVIAAVAFYALKQVRMMKADINARAERAAMEKAIDASSQYLNEYVPLFSVFFAEYEKNKLTSYEGPIGDFTPASIPKSFLPMTDKRYKIHSWLAALNKLESIAALFCTGVADERVGFDIIGRTFSGSVVSLYDIISIVHNAKVHPYFHNTVKLYQIWGSRISKEELQVARQGIESRIALIPNKSIDPLAPKI